MNSSGAKEEAAGVSPSFALGLPGTDLGLPGHIPWAVKLHTGASSFHSSPIAQPVPLAKADKMPAAAASVGAIIDAWQSWSWVASQ